MPRPPKTPLIICAAALALALSAKADIGSFTDVRDGQVYRTVTVGGQLWLAENINYETGDSWCYGGDNANCAKYGRLYTWESAKFVCPGGWHLLRAAEADSLIKEAGGFQAASDKLKSTVGWNDYRGADGNGTNDFGFTALPGGIRRHKGGVFSNAGNFGYWWNSTVDTHGREGYRYIYYSTGAVDRNTYGREDALSVRCVED